MSRTWLAIRIWFLLAVIAVSLISTPALAQGTTAVVRTDPATAAVKVNDSFTITVKAENIANLTAIELHLSFNPAVLEVTSLTNGGFVAADFTAQSTYDNTAGTIDYAIAQMNRAPAQGSGALLGINFRAKTDGISTITVRATQAVPGGILLSDKNGTAIPASWAGSTITVGTPTQVTVTATTPAPTTVVPPTTVPPTTTPVPTTPAAPAILGTHTVRWSETLYCIGRAYKVSPWAIADKNGIGWPYMIFPGQKLNIPNVPWIPPAGRVCPGQFTVPTPTSSPTPVVTATVVVTATSTPVPVACRATYVVQSGDTLYRIATRYGIKYEELGRANNISSPWTIYIGQTLCIP
jgi:LysM repeat protein